MTSDPQSHFNLPIYEQAADWLIELREGEVDAAARERLDAWFRASPEHIRAYLELTSIWEDGADPDIAGTHSTEELIAYARSATNVVPLNVPAAGGGQALPETRATQLPGEVSKDQRDRRRPRRWRPLWAAAAVIACVAGSARLYVDSQRHWNLTTETGEQRFVKLADGSTLELNSRSRVRIRFSDRERDIDLIEGQALFHVAKDSARPFIVRSGSTLVRAVGTEFDVYRKASGTTVTVVEGRVAVLSPIPGETGREGGSSGSAVPPPVSPPGRSTRPPLPEEKERPPSAMQSPLSQKHEGPVPADKTLSDAAHAIYLSAGEQITVDAQVAPHPQPADTAVATAWTQHELVFDSTSLSDVAQEFNRYNTRQLVITDAALRDFHITGVFSSTDPTSFLRFLRAQRDITVLETNEDIRVSRK
jgi:transmembrane sensor